jgi:hypothetical protein
MDVVGDARETLPQLDRSREFSPLLIDSADRSGIRLGDDRHRRSMGTHPAAGNVGGCGSGRSHSPCTKVWSSHVVRATSCRLPRKNRAAAQAQGTTNCATGPWPELFVTERLRRLLSTAVHNQYRCGAFCTGRRDRVAALATDCGVARA